MFRYLALLCLQLVLLSVDMLGSTQEKPRIKRASSVQQSPKLSVKHLALVLAEKHDDGNKAKESISILQRDSCTAIKSIGKPITHNTRWLNYGAWMKDPLGIMGTETIFTMEHFHSDVVQEFENMAKFKAGLPRKTYKLPYYWDGTGAVVYGPYLFFNRANTNYIVKYNLQTERVETQITLSGYLPRKNYYQWGGYSGVDLAVDEQGLWVLWGSTSNSKRLVASKIDVYKNVLTQTWSLNTSKHQKFIVLNFK